MAKTIGVMLSGCGVFDGSEIQEAVFTLLYLDKAGANVMFIAPDVPQRHVINHLKGEPAVGETRNVLVESARIARGKVRSAKTVKASQLDGLILPGGYGAAKNLSSFAVDGPNCSVHPEVDRLIREIHAAGKPLGFVCIAPVVAAKVLGENVALTIGNDEDTAAAIEAMGAKHVKCSVDALAIDEANKVVSVPSYMFGAASPSAVATGIEKLVKQVIEWVK